MLNTLTTTFMPGIKTSKSGWTPRELGSVSNSNQMPKTGLKFPPFSQTFNVSDYLEGSISKRNTVEHIKRVKNIQASRDNRVIFVDPMSGYVQHQGPERKTSYPTSPAST